MRAQVHTHDMMITQETHGNRNIPCPTEEKCNLLKSPNTELTLELTVITATCTALNRNQTPRDEHGENVLNVSPVMNDKHK